MCKVRVFRKSSDVIFSDIVDCHGVTINLIDRPAYAVYDKASESHAIKFIFSNDKECKRALNTANVNLEYGVNSGRLYEVTLKKDSIYNTDLFKIVQELERNSKTKRYLGNIKNFTTVINQIVKFAIDNPK